MPALDPLPQHPADLVWPTDAWPEARPGADVDADRVHSLLARVFLEAETFGETLALVAIHRGGLVLERYGEGHHRDESFVSWSMAKSITHALVGLLVGDGKLVPERPASVAAWRADGDPRGAITLEHMLRMVDGLDFVEVYEAEGISHVVDMLFREGKDDVAAFAAARPLAHAPGTCWSYSSGTSNVVARIVGDVVGGGKAGMLAFMRRRLLDPMGMRSAEPRFDAAGTFIGSSYVFATARDFARFGYLYLRDGCWHGERLLPEGWVDHARTTTQGSAGEYGAHWWLGLVCDDSFHASGFNGQYTIVVPTRDLVLVRLGVSNPEQRERLKPWLRELVEAFPLTVEGLFQGRFLAPRGQAPE